MTYANVAATYRQNAVLTASPEKIVIMLYDGAIQSLEKSRAGLADETTRRNPEVGLALGKALSILGELRSSLDHDAGGEIAKQLDSLYDYSIDRISAANMDRNITPVDDTLRVLRTLKEGWDGIIPH